MSFICRCSCMLQLSLCICNVSCITGWLIYPCLKNVACVRSGGLGCGEKNVFFQTIVMNAVVVSGLSAVTYWLAVMEMYGLVALKRSSQIADMEPEFPPVYLLPVGFQFPVGILLPEHLIFRSSSCHCHHCRYLLLQNVLTFWYWLTTAVLEYCC